jgi:hypothetical protein
VVPLDQRRVARLADEIQVQPPGRHKHRHVPVDYDDLCHEFQINSSSSLLHHLAHSLMKTLYINMLVM